MVKVTLKGHTLAESDKTVVVEGNHYFPPADVRTEFFNDSDTHTVCGWKGTANYYHVKLPDGTVTADVAWYYPETKGAAENIKSYVAFYKNKVEIK